MSKTLVCIHSYAKARAQVEWTWPHYLTGGCDILGVTPVDSSHPWPSGCRHTCIGHNGYVNTPEIVGRIIGTWDYVLNHREFDAYTDFMIIEYDACFFQPVPPHPGGFATQLAGGNIWPQSFKSKLFFHTPWWPDRATAVLMVAEGRKMLAEGDYEKGYPDFFIGRLLERLKLPWTETKSWSVNGGNFGPRKYGIIQPLKDGIFYAHGFRDLGEISWCIKVRDGTL